MNKFSKIIMATLVLISPIILNVAFAQVAPPPPPPPPAGVPIEGGLFLLLSGLAAYGAKKVYGK